MQETVSLLKKLKRSLFLLYQLVIVFQIIFNINHIYRHCISQQENLFTREHKKMNHIIYGESKCHKLSHSEQIWKYCYDITKMSLYKVNSNT